MQEPGTDNEVSYFYIAGGPETHLASHLPACEGVEGEEGAYHGGKSPNTVFSIFQVLKTYSCETINTRFHPLVKTAKEPCTICILYNHDPVQASAMHTARWER